jgi:hypothetical protein
LPFLSNQNPTNQQCRPLNLTKWRMRKPMLWEGTTERDTLTTFWKQWEL